MDKVESPHAMHDEHLCYLVNMGYIESNFNDYKELVKDATFVCKKCGRSANSGDNLCQPQKIYLRYNCLPAAGRITCTTNPYYGPIESAWTAE
jgi:hypothetical protein